LFEIRMRQRKKNEQGKSEDKSSSASQPPVQKSKRGIFGKILRFCLFLVVLVGLLAVLNFFLVKMERSQLEPYGTLVNVGQYNLTLYCEGSEDSEDLIFIVPGDFSSALSFTHFMRNMSGTKRVCSYDRPQRLFSGGTAEDRTAKQYVEDVSKVISAARGNSTHLILIGHSLGGLIASSYAVTHPNDVYSLLLLDSVPSNIDLPEGQRIESRVRTVLQTLKVFSALGLFRITTLFKPLGMWYQPQTPDLHPYVTLFWNDPNNIHDEAKHAQPLIRYLTSKLTNQFPLNIAVKILLSHHFGLGCSSEWKNLWGKEEILKRLSPSTVVEVVPRSDHNFPVTDFNEIYLHVSKACDKGVTY